MLNNGPLFVDATSDASPDSGFNPALTVKGGAKIEKNIVTGGHVFVEEGNVFAKNVNCSNFNSDFSVSNRIVVHEINEFDIGHGIVVHGNLRVSGGDLSANLAGNVIIKHNANVYHNLTVSNDTVLRGNLLVYQNTVFDGEIRAWNGLVIRHLGQRIDVGSVVTDLVETVRKQQEDIRALQAIVQSLHQEKMMTRRDITRF